MELMAERTAVIAVHCQGDIVAQEGAFASFFHEEIRRRGVIEKVGGLLGAARKAGIHVIYTRVAFAPDYSNLVPNSPLLQEVRQGGSLKEGSALAEIVEPLAPTANDTVITHASVGGMNPELHKLLSERNIDTLLFAGVATNLSVESTARAAVDLGYKVFLVEDACSAASPEAHQATVGSLSLLGGITTVQEVGLTLLTTQPI